MERKSFEKWVTRLERKQVNLSVPPNLCMGCLLFLLLAAFVTQCRGKTTLDVTYVGRGASCHASSTFNSNSSCRAAMDGDPGTHWMTKAGDITTASRPWINITFPTHYNIIRLRYKHAGIFSKKAKNITLSFGDGTYQLVTLDIKTNYQKRSIRPVRYTTFVLITIRSTYPSSPGNDRLLAIGEIELHARFKDVQTKNGNGPCALPFVFRGNTYDSCIKSTSEAWCNTEDKSWAYCKYPDLQFCNRIAREYQKPCYPFGMDARWYSSQGCCNETRPNGVFWYKQEQDCGPYKFGRQCKSECHCKSGPCDAVSGICPDGGCQFGWKGNECSVRERFPVRTQNCTASSVYNNDKRYVCQKAIDDNTGTAWWADHRMVGEWINVTLNIPHRIRLISVKNAPGIHNKELKLYFSDGTLQTLVLEKTPEDKYALNQSVFTSWVKIVIMSLYDTTYESTGIQSVNFTAEYQECAKYRYGLKCDKECHCAADSCNSSGKCPEAEDGSVACKPGWKGEKCSQSCDPFRYGAACKSECHCVEKSCDKVSGLCPDGADGKRCQAGWKGTKCDIVCEDFTYGNDCSQKCYCANGPCRKDTGMCHLIPGQPRCQAGWKRLACDTECTEGKYGADCAQMCHCEDNRNCDRITGPTYKCQCKSTYFNSGDTNQPTCVKMVHPNISTLENEKKNAGRPSKLTCAAKGRPLPKQENIVVKGTRSGLLTVETSEIKSTGMVQQRHNLYKIDHLQAENFTCTVNTIAGRAENAYTAQVYTLPVLAWGSIDIQYYNATQITLSWRPWGQTDSGDGPIVSYTVVFTITSAPVRWKMMPPVKHIQDQKDTYHQTIKDLKPNTNYTFSVRTSRQGEGGMGRIGPTVKVHTPCSEPTEGPKITVVERLGNAVKITWEVPSKITWNCDTIHSFQITINYSDGSNKITTVDGTKHQTMVELTRPSEKYNVTMVFLNNNQLQSPRSTYERPIPGRPGHSGLSPSIKVLLGFLVVIIVAMLIVFIFVYIRTHRRSKKSPWHMLLAREKNDASTALNGAGVHKESDNMDTALQKRMSIRSTATNYDENMAGAKAYAYGEVPDDTDQETDDEAIQIYENTTKRVRTIRLDMDELILYILDKKTNKGSSTFKEEYEEIPRFFNLECSASEMQKNRIKNRYRGIMPYDTNRVIFSVDPTDEQSTGYINASYVTGYKETRSFIAAQGPKKNTVVDFWRMVWDNKVYKIVMLARTTEGGQRKCEQYWPDQLGAVTYGQTIVSLLRSQTFTDYTIRQLRIQKDEDTRLIRQYHFLTWPDHGVPDYGAALMSLRKKVISHVHPAEGPTVVHCSAGVGRTGTYIALDYLMEQLKEEGVVDIFTCVQALRAQRKFMVQTLEQYVFIYDTILETYTCGDSLIPCSNFEQIFHRLSTPNAQTGKTRLEQQYELLTLTTHPVQQSACKGALRPENTGKNRDPGIIPADRHRPFLTMTRITDRSDYINAVFVSGYRQKNSFLATQHPLPDTVVDFWRMIYDFKCTTIVMLNDFKEENDDYSMYWPDQGILELGPLKIELILCSEASDMVTRTLKLSKVSKDGEVIGSTVVKQFQLTCWPHEDPLPSNPDDVVSLFSGVQQWQQSSGDGMVTVHCKDGASRSGLLCVSYYMLEKMNVEQEVDVFHTTKRLRVSRPQFIISQEQFNFCYEVARSYINTFETYANFK